MNFKLFWKNTVLCGIFSAGLLLPQASFCDTNKGLPLLNEAISIISTNMVGVDTLDLDAKAFQGLIQILSPSVQIVDGNVVAKSEEQSAPDQNIADLTLNQKYLSIHIQQLVKGTANTIFEKWTTLQKEHSDAGLILDLRNAYGTNYEAVTEIASLFIKEEATLFTLNQESFKTAPSDKHISGKIAILTNRKTANAPEALAAILQEKKIAIVIGTNTSGQAVKYQNYPLSNGQILRVAVDSVHYGSDKFIGTSGVTPDISVKISEADEIAYMKDPFTSLRMEFETDPDTAAAKKSLQRINEAQLVRLQNGEKEKSESVEEEKVVYDPVLGRALDFLETIRFFSK